MEAGECLSPADVNRFITESAHDMDGSSVPGFPDGYDHDSGYGLIDADAALALLDNNPVNCSTDTFVYLPIILNNYDSSELLKNGSFDTGDFSPWQIAGSPALDDQKYHSAPYSARLGGVNDTEDYVVQEVMVPADATEVTLDFWYRVSGTDPEPFCYEIIDVEVENVFAGVCLAIPELVQNQWLNDRQLVISGDDLTPLLGQKRLVAFNVFTDGTNPGTAWVDDVSFKMTGTGP